MSGVRDDIFSDSECDRECKRKRLSSDSEKTSDDSNTRNAGATKWSQKKLKCQIYENLLEIQG
jgi:hypothetical protein